MIDYELPKEKPLTLKTAVETIDQVGPEMDAFYNTITGEIYVELPYNSVMDEDEEINLNTQGWVSFPDALDKEELRQMRKFARQQPDPVGKELLDAAYKRHPYRAFKDAATRLGCRNAWFAYYDEWLRELAHTWADQNGIELAETEA